MCSGNVAGDARVRGRLVGVDAVLEVRWLRIRSVELVRRVRNVGRHVGGVRVGPAAAEQRPAAVELHSNRLEPAVSLVVESPLLRFVPEAVLLVDKGVDPVEYWILGHEESVGPKVRREAARSRSARGRIGAASS